MRHIACRHARLIEKALQTVLVFFQAAAREQHDLLGSRHAVDRAVREIFLDRDCMLQLPVIRLIGDAEAAESADLSDQIAVLQQRACRQMIRLAVIAARGKSAVRTYPAARIVILKTVIAFDDHIPAHSMLFL